MDLSVKDPRNCTARTLYLGMFFLPKVFKFGRGEIAEGGMNAFEPVDLVDELPDLVVGVVKIEIVGQVHLFIVDRADDPLGEGVLHRDAHPAILI